MKRHARFFQILSLALFLSVLIGCGGSNPSSASSTGNNLEAASPSKESGSIPDKVKVGIINPTTGVLAGFGEGAPWTEKLVVDYVNDELGGVYFEEYGKKLPIEIIVYDSESDTTKCTELTQKLITDDKVDLIVARHTPETINPVSAVCERYEIPCICMDAPVDAWLNEGPYEWSVHSHWNIETFYKCHASLWQKAGFGEGTKVGILFANDADGAACSAVFAEMIQKDGFELVDPGLFPPGTQDFSEIVQTFKREGVEVLCGTNTNSDFATFWRQCKQLGFEPGFVAMGKAYLFESDAMAIGPDLMDGLTCEVWWDPIYPYTSSLTGETPAGLAQKYLEATGRSVTPPMAIKYASMEVMVDALSRAGSLDKTAVRDAILETDLDTIIGNINYTEEHYALTVLSGGQWVKNDQGGLDLYIVDNTLFPEIPTNGTLKPLK